MILVERGVSATGSHRRRIGLDGTKFEKGCAVPSVRQLNTELSYLQTACFVLIAFATGMRVSELLSLGKAAVETQKECRATGLGVAATAGCSKCKVSRMVASAKWLGGPVCGKAVSVLETIGTAGAATSRGSLSVDVDTLLRRRREYTTGSLVAQPTMLLELDDFLAMLRPEGTRVGRPFHIHPHMFRRTFARHVARHDTTNLLALKEHFKHISLSMTDYYVGK